MNLREAIIGLLKREIKIVSYDYPYEHFNVVLFSDGSLSTNESSYSSYTIYGEEPLLTVSIRYFREADDNVDDIDDIDYDEIVDNSIEKEYREGITQIDLYEKLKQEYK